MIIQYVNVVIFGVFFEFIKEYLVKFLWSIFDVVYYGLILFMLFIKDVYVVFKEMGIYREIGYYEFEEVNVGIIV